MSRDVNKVYSNSNVVQIVGKVMSVTISSGKTSAGIPFQSARTVLRVAQTFGGNEETEEIEIRSFATQYTMKGAPNPGWESINNLRGVRTAQNVGIDAADVMQIRNGTLKEVSYVSRSGQTINGFEIDSVFFNIVSSPQKEFATFQEDIYVLGITDEVDRNGNMTGRVIVRGGIVGYKAQLNVMNFIIEDASKAEQLRNSWSENDTVRVHGFVRVTSKATTDTENADDSDNGWGEDIPVLSATNDVLVRELVIAKGFPAMDEDNAYDPVEIKKLYNVRKSLLEQKIADATNKPKSNTVPHPAAVKSASAFSAGFDEDWGE